MRLFLAINPADDVRRRLAAASAVLRTVAPSLRWVPPNHLHLTVRFLGEMPADHAAHVRAAIDRAASRHADTPLVLREIGAFPNFRRARVIWLGVEPHPRLELLHHDVEEACAALGIEPEGKPFRPHITLARVPADTGPETLRALFRAARRVTVTEAFAVDSIDLMASERGVDGKQYRLLHASPLMTTA